MQKNYIFSILMMKKAVRIIDIFIDTKYVF